MNQIMVMKKILFRKGISFLAPFLMDRYFSKSNQKISWKGKKSAMTISFDCDFLDDVTSIPRILETLDSFNISSSFACIGKFIEEYPKVHRELLEKGHEIINHTHTHPDSYWNPTAFFNRLRKKEKREEIIKFEKTSKKFLEYSPIGFRTPHFGNLHGPIVYEILEELGYTYSSSTNLINTKSHGLPYNPSKSDFRVPSKHRKNGHNVLELPLMPCPEHYYSLFDTYHCFRSIPPAHPKDGEFFELFKKSLNYALKYGVHINFYFDPRDVANLKDFERSLELLDEHRKEIWISRSEEVARWWRDKNS